MKVGYVVFGIAASFGLTLLAHAQTANERNYRQNAVCVEKIINGRMFNTFGEGPCPPGSRRLPLSTPYNRLDPNERKLAQTQAAVNAIGGLQQAMVAGVQAWAQAHMQQKRADTVRILTTYVFDIPPEKCVSAVRKYVEITRFLPGVDGISTAEHGGAIVTSQTGFYADCFALSELTERVKSGWVHSMKPNEPSCKVKPDDKTYTASYLNVSSP